MSASLDALQGLANSDLNANNTYGLVQSRLRKEQMLADLKRNLALQAGAPKGTMVAGATQPDVDETESELADSPNFGTAAQQHTGEVQQTNDSINTYNRPDVGAVRHEQQGDALQRILAPVQMKGQYDVEAARQGALAAAMHDDRMIDGQREIEGMRQEGLSTRSNDTQESMAARLRLQALQTGKAHAARAGGFLDTVFGPSQSSLDQKEIADLMARLGGGGGDAPHAEESHALGTVKVFPNGRQARWDGHGWEAF